MIEIEKEKLDKLIECFTYAKMVCNGLNVYEHPGWDEEIEKRKEWIENTFNVKVSLW